MFQTAGEAMTSSTSANYPVSPFLFQHVPSSPFLRPAKIRSPVPSVPDIDNQIASSKRAVAFIPSASPGPVVPSTPCYYLPISPAPQIAKGMQTPMSGKFRIMLLVIFMGNEVVNCLKIMNILGRSSIGKYHTRKRSHERILRGLFNALIHFFSNVPF